MIRIGAVNIDVSHPKAFSEYLLKGNRARYVAVFNDGFRGDDEVEGFINKFGLERRCSSVEELADYVDIGFIHDCNWEKHLEHAMPFIKKNKPVFIDKPIAGSLSHCKLLEELSEQGAAILGSSSLRYAQEVVDFNSISREQRGEVVNAFGTCGVDEFNYCIHIVEAISDIMGMGAVSAKFAGRGEREGKACETYLVRYENGATAVYNSFQGKWQPCDMVIMTTKMTHSFRFDDDRAYVALLDRICDYMESGKKTMASVKALTESVKIMLAGRLSKLNGGTEVKLSEIPEDDPGYDGYQFEKKYAAASKRKIYIEE